MFALYAQAGAVVEPGVAALDAGRLAEARLLLEAAVGRQPRNGVAWANLARLYAALSEKEKAARAAARAERLIAGSPETQHALALYYAQTGNRKRAAELECLYAASGKADEAASARAALLSAEVGNWRQAIDFGLKAVERGRRLDALIPMLARAYDASGQPEQALRMRRRLTELQPYSEEAHSDYGIALLRAGRFNQAVEFLESASRAFDKSAQIALALGTGYYAQRRFSDAASAFLRAAALAPEAHQPYVFLSRMLDQIPDRVAEVLTAAKSWHASGSSHPYAPYVLARALAASGQGWQQIRSLLEESIRRDPKVWEFHFELGRYLEQERDFGAAAAAYEKSIACDPKRPEPHYRLARVYERLGRSAEAQRHRQIHAELVRNQSEVSLP